MAESNKPISSNFNWALVLNAGLLLVVVIGAWFSTFSNPLNDKFTTLDKSLSAQQQIQSQRIDGLRAEILAQLEASQKASNLALETVKAINDEIEKSIERRFHQQDVENDQLQKQLDARFTEVAKQHDEYRQDYRDLLSDIERRRAEIATRSDVQTVLAATRVELLAEIKRVDQRAEILLNSTLPRKEFEQWAHELELSREASSKRVEWLAQRMQDHERDERSYQGGFRLAPDGLPPNTSRSPNK